MGKRGVLHQIWFCINRIRLEFKVFQRSGQEPETLVLIESDWNLKDTKLQPRSTWRTSINRIRLEFKVNWVYGCDSL